MLAADRHPTLTFAGDGLHITESGWRMPGRQTVRGVDNDIVWSISECQVSGAELRVRAVAQVDRVLCEIRGNRALAAHHVTETWHVEASTATGRSER